MPCILPRLVCVAPLHKTRFHMIAGRSVRSARKTPGRSGSGDRNSANQWSGVWSPCGVSHEPIRSRTPSPSDDFSRCLQVQLLSPQQWFTFEELHSPHAVYQHTVDGTQWKRLLRSVSAPSCSWRANDRLTVSARRPSANRPSETWTTWRHSSPSCKKRLNYYRTRYRQCMLRCARETSTAPVILARRRPSPTLRTCNRWVPWKAIIIMSIRATMEPQNPQRALRYPRKNHPRRSEIAPWQTLLWT